MKHRFFAAAGALLLSAAWLTGCGESGETETMDELPYGATLTKTTDRDIALSYDARFIDDELAGQIHAYYHSIQARDAEEFASAIFPLYHDYQLEEVYGGQYTDQDLLDTTYDAITEYFEMDDFVYSMVEVTDLVAVDGVSSDRDQFLAMLDDLAADKNAPKISQNATYFYQMLVTRYVTEPDSGVHSETDDVLTDETLYAIEYEGKWYLIYV